MQQQPSSGINDVLLTASGFRSRLILDRIPTREANSSSPGKCLPIPSMRDETGLHNNIIVEVPFPSHTGSPPS